MNIVVIDDDKIFTENFHKLLSQNIDDFNYYSFHNLDINLLPNHIDILFLDVLFNNDKSFKFGEMILEKYPNIILVYISSIDNFIYDSIEQNTFYFIRKSNLENDFNKFYKKYMSIITNKTKFLQVISDRYTYIINQSNITYIESFKNNVTIHTIDNSYKVYKSLTKILSDLDHKSFYRLNKFIIINLDRIDSFNDKNIIINNEYIEFTRGSRNSFIETFGIYKRGNL